MKDLNMIGWLTQLGLSVAAPLVCFIGLALWLQQRFDLGSWVLITGVIAGVISAADGFRICLKAMERMSKNRSKDTEPPPVSFNDHD